MYRVIVQYFDDIQRRIGIFLIYLKMIPSNGILQVNGGFNFFFDCNLITIYLKNGNRFSLQDLFVFDTRIQSPRPSFTGSLSIDIICVRFANVLRISE